MHDLLDQVTSFLIVHRPDLLDTLVVSFLELFKALLELDKFSSELLVFLGVQSVLVLGLGLLNSKLKLLLTKYIAISLEPSPESLSLSLEDCLTFAKHLIIEFKLLFIELVDSFHVFHALFENLHLCLQLDLLLSLLVSILAHDLFELLGIALFLLLTFGQVVVLNLLVLVKEIFNLFLIAAKNRSALTIKISFNRLKLLVIMLAHLTKLRLHAHDQGVDILRHLLNCLDIVTVFLINLSLKLPNQLCLV